MRGGGWLGVVEDELLGGLVDDGGTAERSGISDA
jgi:hypothetical protein